MKNASDATVHCNFWPPKSKLQDQGIKEVYLVGTEHS